MRANRIVLLVAILATLAAASRARAQPCPFNVPHVDGAWTTLPILMPINPISATLMHNGRILLVAGSEDDPYNDQQAQSYRYAVWDPTIPTQDAIDVQLVDFDVFCSATAVLPDGRPLVVGGTSDYSPSFEGDRRASIFDPATASFAQTASMVDGRWYATATSLGDGRVMAFSGTAEDGTKNNTVEIFALNSAGAPWTSPVAAPFDPPLYPRQMLLPNGQVFFTGQGNSQRANSWLFTPATASWVSSAATTIDRTYGAAVLLPLYPPTYKPKVMNFGGNGSNTTETINLSVSSPTWTAGPTMSAGRIQNNAVILPNGRVHVQGGSAVNYVPDAAGKIANTYNPATGTMGSGGTAFYSRLYHSVGVLLPDATVASFGSNPNGGAGYEPSIEIYTPPYLFDANDVPITTARPVITNVTASPLGYGAAFTVTYTSTAAIASAVLIRPGSVTHADDMEQRLVGLCGASPQPACSPGSGTISLTTPANGNLAPPGYYMLFLVDSAGVPSVAQFIQLSPYATTPPAGTITSPASDVTIAPGQSVSFAAATGAAQYSWVFTGGSPATSSARVPGNVSFANPGEYVVTMTAIDAAGNTDPSPPTRTITVVPWSRDFEISVTPPWWLIAPGQSVPYTVMVTPEAGFSGTVTLSLKVQLGLPAGVTATFNPPTITGGGSSTMTVNTTTRVAPWAMQFTVQGTSGSLVHGAATTLLIQLDPPATLTATPGTGKVTLSWPAALGATGYQVKRGLRSGGPYVGIGCTSGISFNDTSVSSGTTYYYVVASTFSSGPNAGGEGANSSEASATLGSSTTTSTSSSTSTSTSTTRSTSTSTTRSTSTSTTRSTSTSTSTTSTTTTAPGGTTTTLAYTYQDGATGCGNANCGAAVLDVQISDASNHNGADLPVGSAGPPFRVLFEFDVSDIGAGKVITGASLNLDLVVNRSVTGGKFCRLRRTDWSETQATWNVYKTANNWTAAGASNVTNDVESPGAGNTACVAYRPPVGTGHVVFTGLGPLVQDALDVRAGKLRLRIKQDTETSGGDYWRALDSEHTPVNVRPKLTVTFANAGGTTTTTTTPTTTTTTTTTGMQVLDQGPWLTEELHPPRLLPLHRKPKVPRVRRGRPRRHPARSISPVA